MILKICLETLNRTICLVNLINRPIQEPCCCVCIGKAQQSSARRQKVSERVISSASRCCVTTRQLIYSSSRFDELAKQRSLRSFGFGRFVGHVGHRFSTAMQRRVAISPSPPPSFAVLSPLFHYSNHLYVSVIFYYCFCFCISFFEMLFYHFFSVIICIF